MAENGILDYQGMNQAIYRGATSNIVVDTQSMSIEIGAGNTSHTSNLHFECNHVANVASIKLNSNVVTEFPRSKKLIKYPRVALTQNALNNGYAAVASSENNGSSSGQAYRAFDGNAGGERGYHSAASTYSSGSYTGSVSITDAHGTQHQGEWIKLQMPTTEKMKLSGFSFSPRYVSTADYEHRAPYKGVFLGSTDGTNWYPIHHFDNVAVPELTTVSRTFENNTNDYYNHIALVVYEVGPNATYGDVLNFAEMELFGLPEYDPEAHGTDVVVKSVPNVPNTDWLEVYYDGQDYTSMPATVTDKSGNNRTGTPSGGVGFDTGYKAFTFDGANDGISTTSTATLSDHTASMWIKFDSPAAWEAIYSILPVSGGNDRNNAVLYVGNNYFRLESVGNAGPIYDFSYNFVAGVWVHLTLVFRGTGLSDAVLYINNNIIPGGGVRSVTDNITITGNNTVSAGTQPGSYWLHGSIANFRLFNRALTSDEVWQLYAYQKEYFGHGDLSMTLKAGRLYVNGDIHANGGRVWPIPNAVFQRLTPSTTSTSSYYSNNIGTHYVTFDTIYLNDDSRTIQFSPSSTNITLSRTGVYEIITQSGLALQNASTATHAGIQINILSGGATTNSQYGYATFPTMGYGAVYNTSKTHKITVTSAPAIVRYRIQPRANNSGYLKETAYGPNNVLHSIDIKYLG